MDKSDWDNAMSHLEKYKDSAYIKEANEIVKNYFTENSQKGCILKENEYYKRDKEEYDKYIEDFISDLKELFEING